ncbi:TPA: hypothetical protein N0F65_012459 [Lagenidium giganteum]|uniref:Uncharacterized protein n=1 Tax=Lagenidium giganteum TaxID=4803 RepID=A0AAV2YJ25_9STRA|nr:TPA: hypothetical protein N0F65_012459 [Lagenidium giganteum]
MDSAVLDAFQEKVLTKPEAFFTPSDAIATDIKQFTKYVFDHCTQYVSKNSNGPLLAELSKRIKGFNKNPEKIRLFPSGEEEEAEAPIDEQDDDEEAGSEDEAEAELSDADDAESMDEQEDDDDEPKEQKKADKKKSSKKKNKRAKDEEGLDEMDLDGDDDDDDDEPGLDDDEEDDEEDEEAANMKYDDFFDEPNADDDDEEDEEEEEEEEDKFDEEEELPSIRRNAEDDEPVDEDDLAERGIMSSHQRRQQRLQEEIKKYEQEAVTDKPWELKGEVKSAHRPENSLLEAVLDYDRPTNVAPVITVEVSVALEDMIKKRILEDNFDDVVRKFAANEEDQKNKLEEVSMEKSKEGLGEIYEKEYMKNAMGFEADDGSKQEQEEIDVMFKSLCWKLDALSNFNFTPKPMVKELQVKPAVPAIAMEEVVPIGVSDANLQAPEEVFEKKRKRGEAVLQSRDEMSQDQRRAQRNAKKQARRKELRHREADEKLAAKINPGLGNKYAKKKLMEDLANARNVTKGKEIEGSTKQFSNSKEFFSRLQVKSQLHSTIPARSPCNVDSNALSLMCSNRTKFLPLSQPRPASQARRRRKINRDPCCLNKRCRLHPTSLSAATTLGGARSPTV